MSEFKKYRRKQIAELRPVSKFEIESGVYFLKEINISVSKEDESNGSPLKGDMIARNPKNHKDQWLVAEQYFNDNFESIK